MGLRRSGTSIGTCFWNSAYGSPKVRIPDSWYIWEPLAIRFDDGGAGVKKIALTIYGDNYGNRSYSWTAGNVPDDFIWDRRFGEIIAPIGEYEVSVEAWDHPGNKTTAYGEIVIPAPDPTPDPFLDLPAASASRPTEIPRPTPTPRPESSSRAIVWTPTATSAALAFALEPEREEAASVQSEDLSLPPAVPARAAVFLAARV